MDERWVRRVSTAIFAISGLTTVVVVDDLEIVAIGTLGVIVAALLAAAAVLVATSLVVHRRPAATTAFTVICLALAVWAPLPSRWHDPCSDWGVTALWAAPIATPLDEATGIAGVAYDSRLESCL